MSHSSEWKNDFACWHYKGVVTLGEILGAQEAMFNDPRFEELRYFMVNLSGVDSISFPSEMIEMLAAKDGICSSYKKELRQAFVAADPILRNLIERYAVRLNKMGAGWEVGLFSSEQDAHFWLFADGRGGA